MLFVDKYRPGHFEEFIIHDKQADVLKGLISQGNFPHTLLYGPSGAGKKTLVRALLRQIFGPGVEKVKVDVRPWIIQLPSRKLELELMTVQSNYHIEINPQDVGYNDRYVVQEVIKEMAQNRAVELKGIKLFKVLVLNEVDGLSKDAQHALRRTMEKYSSICKIVMCACNISKVIEPIRSRCVCIRVPAPTKDESMAVLEKISNREDFQLPRKLAEKIIEESQGNLRKAILCLETCKVQNSSLKADQQVVKMEWEMYIQEIAQDIMGEQSPKRLYLVRGKLYELLINCIPPDIIMQTLLNELMSKLDDELKFQTCQWASFYEHRMVLGSKQIFHLEAFVAKFMSLYKSWSLSAFS